MLPCVATCVAKEPKVLRTCVHVVASGEESRLSKRVMATISEYNQEGTVLFGIMGARRLQSLEF